MGEAAETMGLGQSLAQAGMAANSKLSDAKPGGQSAVFRERRHNAADMLMLM